MKAALLSLCLLLIAPALKAQFNRLDAETRQRVESVVAGHVGSTGMVGCSVGILVDGEIAYLKGFGLQDREAGIPASERTIYRTGSVAKTFTAIAAMQLYEQGMLGLQADVRTYVPEYPEKPQGTITPYRLLVHRSGIRHYEEMNEDVALYYERDHREYDPVAAIDLFKDGSLLFQPGTQFSYTTFGYNLLGAAVERAGNQPFLEQVRERINRPLHLPYLQAEYQRKRPYPNETAGYHNENGTMVRTPDDIGILFKVPGGGFICSVIDLTLTVKGLMEYRLFADSSTQVWMSQDHNNGNPYAGGTGFGVGIINGEHDGKHYLWHAGGQQRTATFWAYYPGTGLGVAVMSNTYASAAKQLGLQLMDAVGTATLSGRPYTFLPDTLGVPALHAPYDFEHTSGTDVSLEWSSVGLAHKYVCEYMINGGAWQSDTVYTLEHMLQGLSQNDTVRWRVKAVNEYLYDGVSGEWSGVFTFIAGSSTHIANVHDPESWHVTGYPNPASGVVHLRSSRGKIRSVEVVDVLGRVRSVYIGPDAASCSLNLQEFQPGMLFLRITNTQGMTTMKRVIRR